MWVFRLWSRFFAARWCSMCTSSLRKADVSTRLHQRGPFHPGESLGHFVGSAKADSWLFGGLVWPLSALGLDQSVWEDLRNHHMFGFLGNLAEVWGEFAYQEVYLDHSKAFRQAILAALPETKACVGSIEAQMFAEQVAKIAPSIAGTVQRT